MNKFKEVLLSEKGTRILNIVFFVSLILFRGMLFIPCLLWAAYLVFCIKYTKDKTKRSIDYVLLGIAVVLLIVSLGAMLRR